MNKLISRRLARKRRSNVCAKQSNRKIRLLVNRSNLNISAQLIDNDSGKTIGSLFDKSNMKGAVNVGKSIAEIAKKNKISEVVFDRSCYKFHGKVKALAESARKAGLTI